MFGNVSGGEPTPVLKGSGVPILDRVGPNSMVYEYENGRGRRVPTMPPYQSVGDVGGLPSSPLSPTDGGMGASVPGRNAEAQIGEFVFFPPDLINFDDLLLGPKVSCHRGKRKHSGIHPGNREGTWREDVGESQGI